MEKIIHTSGELFDLMLNSFLQHQMEQAEAETVAIIAELLNCNRVEAQVNRSRVLSGELFQRGKEIIQRRLSNEPWQYIFQRAYFRDLRRSDQGNPDVQQHISVETPIGEIYVGITHLDPDYPGIYVDIKGQNVNAQFEKNSVALAVIEFNPENKNIQTLVWKDANQEDYTFAVEHENLVAVPSLSKQIQSAATRTAGSQPSSHVKAKEPETEI